MSQIKLDNIAGLPPIEPAPPNAGQFKIQPAPTESFDDHLQRAQTQSAETSTHSRPDSNQPSSSQAAAADTTPQHASDTQPPADQQPGDSQESADAKSESKTPEQAPPEEPAENDPSEVNLAKTNADDHEESGNAEAGPQTRKEQKTDDLPPDETKVVVDPGQLPGDPAAAVADDPPVKGDAEQPVSEHNSTGRHRESQEGLQRTIGQQQAENGDPQRQTLTKELGNQHDPLPQVVPEETDHSSDKTVEPALPNAEETAATGGNRPDQQGDVAQQQSDGRQEPAAQTSRAEAPRQPPRRSVDNESTPRRAGEDSPKPPTQKTTTSPAVDTRTVLNEQATSAGEKELEPSAGTVKPISDGTSESRSNVPMRVSPNQGSPPGSPQQPQAATEPETIQVDRVRFVQRVAQAFHAAGDRSGSVRLRLNPPQLGSLRLEISVRDGVMTARVEAETPTARNLLLDNLPALRDRLAQQDVKVQQFNVDLMDRSPGGLPEQTADHAQSHHHGESYSPPPANTDADGEREIRSDPGAAHRPGEGTQLNVVI